MKMTHEDQHEMTVMTLSGEFTGEASDRFRRAVLERIDKRIRDFVLDVGGLEAIDSQGLEALLWLQDQCAEHLGQIRLAGSSETLTDVLKATRLSPRFETKADVGSAIQSLGIHHV
ncbi:MAG: STAS domain-containing protein [Planctomycetota bacterium]